MKKRVFALLATLILTFAFTANCFAAPSPKENELPTQEEPTNDPSAVPSVDDPTIDPTKSPKTGVGVAGAFVAIITASGVALTAKKKYSDAE